MKNFIKLIILGALSSCLLTACGDSGSNRRTTTRNTLNDCYNQEFNTGIIGNDYCPYRGSYDPNRGYQGFAVSFSAQLGVYIDFGWNYNDLCPVGEVPVLMNGDFSYCDPVNPDYTETDLRFYAAPNAGECAGKQWNSAVTGCLPDFNL